jgi:hypothetical protein
VSCTFDLFADVVCFCARRLLSHSLLACYRHPAFEEDEIELIALGGILGASKYKHARIRRYCCAHRNARRN